MFCNVQRPCTVLQNITAALASVSVKNLHVLLHGVGGWWISKSCSPTHITLQGLLPTPPPSSNLRGNNRRNRDPKFRKVIWCNRLYPTPRKDDSERRNSAVFCQAVLHSPVNIIRAVWEHTHPPPHQLPTIEPASPVIRTMPTAKPSITITKRIQ